MELYVFVSKNSTNIWAGIGSGLWAVSDADPQIMKARKTRSRNIRIGSAGLIYRSDKKALTTPFIITSAPDVSSEESNVWPEVWKMPLGIHPLGNPRCQWDAHDAARCLPFNKDRGETNVASVFKSVGTAVFSPVIVGEEDWELILGKLANLVHRS